MNPSSSSEAYRQALVRDGQRRFQEWQRRYQAHCEAYRADLAQDRQRRSSTGIPSERYRQALVQDGQRRFEEWHQNFLDYQNRFLSEMKP